MPSMDDRPVPVPFKTDTLTTHDGIKLNVELYGDITRPAMLLIHGYDCDLTLLHRLIDELLPGFYIMTYDVRGHGKSDLTPNHDYSVQTMARDIRLVLDTYLPKGRKAVVMGHSMSCPAIVSYQFEYPQHVKERVSAVMLAGSALDQTLAHQRLVPLPVLLNKMLAPVSSYLLRSRLGTGQSKFITQQLLNRFSLTTAKKNKQDVVAQSSQVLLNARAESRSGYGLEMAHLNIIKEAKAMTIPTLLVQGSRDVLTPPWHAERHKKFIPGFLADDMIYLEGEGHMSPLTRPEIVGQGLRDLCERFGEGPADTEVTTDTTVPQFKKVAVPA